MARYKIIACHVLWRELCHYASQSHNIFDFHFLQQGLHCTPDVLRRDLQAAIDAVKDEYSAILIGYGLCSNGIAGVVARNTPLVIMRGHDCITFLLGSRRRYQEYFDTHPGTYWYSPGWIETDSQPGKERYENVRREYAEKYGEDNAEYLMETEQGWFARYTTAAYVDLGFGDNDRHRRYTKECAAWLGWNYDELRGDPRLIQAFLDGQWDSDAFLVVEPGRQIVATNDDAIITTQPAQDPVPPHAE